MKLTTKKSFLRSIIGLGMALLVTGFAAGCSKQLLPPEIEANNNGSGSGMMTGLSDNGGGINEGNVGGGNTGGGNEGATGAGSPGAGFNISEQNEGFPVGSGSGETGGGDPMFIQEGNIAEGDPGHAGSGPEFSGSGEQNFGSGTGMPGDGYTGKAPRHGMASSESGGTFDAFGTGSQSGGTGPLGEGSSTLEHPAETHHPFHTGPNGGSTGSPVGSTGGGMAMGGMTQQEARLADFTDSTDLNDIHFAYDQYDLTEESKQVLRSNAEWLKSNPSARIEIQGHCDERGTNNYNLGLGERRALSTKKFLTALGVDANRIFTISYGEEKPFCFDSNDACWTENRRAHFMVAR